MNNMFGTQNNRSILLVAEYPKRMKVQNIDICLKQQGNFLMGNNTDEKRNTNIAGNGMNIFQSIATHR